MLGSFVVAGLVLLVAMTAVPIQSSSEPPSSASAASFATLGGRPSSLAGTSSTRTAVKVEFSQLRACTPPVYTTPWLVKLVGTAENGSAVNESEEQPVGADLSVYNSGGYTASAAGANFSVIVFPSVPVGTYNYTVTPHGAFYNPTGSLTVNGSANLEIVMEGPVVSCAVKNG